MLNFLKKSRAAFGNLHNNSLEFFVPTMIALFYGLFMILTIQSGTAFGVLFNILVFALLGAGVKEGNSLFHSLALSDKEKVNLAYKTFCFWAMAVLLFKGTWALVWKGFVQQLVGGNIFDAFYFTEPSMTTYYGIALYGFLISVGFEFLLFPILFVENKKRKILYFLKASVVTLLPTIGMNSIGYFLYKTNPNSLGGSWFSIGAFTTFPKTVLLFLLVYAGLFMVAAIIYAEKMALNQYRKNLEARQYVLQTATKLAAKSRRKKKVILGVIMTFVGVFLIGLGFIVSNLSNELGAVEDFQVVGTQLTEDSVFGPMVFQDKVYFPTHEGIQVKETEKETLGFFTFKGEDASGIFYRLFLSNYAYVDKSDKEKIYCWVEGMDFYTYIRADYMVSQLKEKNYKKLVAFDADWLDQQAWAKSPSRVGIHDLDGELFNQLEKTFGPVNYRVKDFENIDAYYGIVGIKEPYVYEEWQSEGDYYLNHSDVIGCVLVKEGKYYYGSLENQMPEEMLPAIKALLAI